MNSEQSKKTEAEFLGKIFAGDDSAFHSLFAIYNKKLVIFAYKMLGEREAARDLAQEVWIRLIDQRRTKERVVIENAGAYLFRIARNLCIDKIRSAKQHLPIEELSEKEHPYSLLGEPSALEEMVIAALDRLPFEDREILVMHSYLGYAYDEIAQMQSKSPEAVWTRASRARSKLREMIRSDAKREGIEISGEKMKINRGERI